MLPSIWISSKSLCGSFTSNADTSAVDVEGISTPLSLTYGGRGDPKSFGSDGSSPMLPVSKTSESSRTAASSGSSGATGAWSTIIVFKQ